MEGMLRKKPTQKAPSAVLLLIIPQGSRREINRERAKPYPYTDIIRIWSLGRGPFFCYGKAKTGQRC